MVEHSNLGGEDHSEADQGLVEAGRLCHAPWLDSTRRTTPDGLVLGSDFVWSDPACYAVGVGLGILVERTGPSHRPAPRT